MSRSNPYYAIIQGGGRLCAISAAALIALAARQTSAATYRMTAERGHSASSIVEFSNPANWFVGDLPENGGEAATACPGRDDTIWLGAIWNTHQGYLALDDDYEVGSLLYNYNMLHLYKSDAASQDTVALTFTGTIGGGAYQQYHAYSGAKIVFAEGSTLRGATSDATASYATVHNGGEIDVYGSINKSRHINWTVETGGVLRFAPTAYVQTTDTGAINDKFTVSGGEAWFPNGLDITGGNASWANTFVQNGGVVTFGGGFASNSPWTYTWNGGEIDVVADCEFSGSVAVEIPASKSVTIDVASGTTFSAASFSADATSTIVKTGGGVFAFAPTSASIVVNDGAIGLFSASSYNLSNVSLGEGATASISLTAMGARVDSLPAALSGATFTADLSSAGAGTVVFYSADADVLGKAASDLASSVPAGFQLSMSGDALSLEVISDYVFNASGDILADVANWSTGGVPAENLEVAIDGEGVVAEYTGGTMPAWTSIEVKNGATLRVSADCTLPPVVLNKNAALEIAGGTVSIENGLSGIALVNGEDVELPALTVAQDATLNVPGEFKFKNVDMTLEGTLTRTTQGSLYFGYAETGETTYIGLHATGARISNYTIGGYSTSIYVCCPATGGSVHPVGDIVFKDMPTSGTHFPAYSDNYWNALAAGWNNPEDIPFNVVFDNARWNANGQFKIGGGAKFRLVNGSLYAMGEHDTLWNRTFNIAGRGSVSVGAGSEMRIVALGNWGNVAATVDSTLQGNAAISVENGGRFEVYRTGGNGNAVFSSAGGTYRIYRPSIYHDNNGSIYSNSNVPFNGFRAVDLAADTTLVFDTRDGTYYKSADGDRIVTMANVPFTGGGSIVLSNANDARFGFVVRSGANTATGSAGVTPVEGTGETTLYFADGANWAGTVVAGNVALTNLASAASAASASFGTLDMSGDFPIRAWSGESGYVSDTVSVGSFIANGGRLVPVLMDEGGEFEHGARIRAGTVGKASPLPPTIAGWRVQTRGIDGDDENVDLYLSFSRGLQVIIR